MDNGGKGGKGARPHAGPVGMLNTAVYRPAVLQ